MKYKTILINANIQRNKDIELVIKNYTSNIQLVGTFISSSDIHKIKQINPQLIFVSDELFEDENIEQLLKALDTLTLKPIIIGLATVEDSVEIYNKHRIPNFDLNMYDIDTIFTRVLDFINHEEAEKDGKKSHIEQADLQEMQATLLQKQKLEQPEEKEHLQKRPEVRTNIYRLTKRKIAVYSPKGGTGKTTIAIELAHQIAYQAKKLNDRTNKDMHFEDPNNIKVLLADMSASLDTMSSSLGSVRNSKKRVSLLTWMDRIDAKVYATFTDKTLKAINNKEKRFEDCFNPNDITFTAEEVEELLMYDKNVGLYILPPIALLQEVQRAHPIYLEIVMRTLEHYFDVIIFDMSNNVSQLTNVALTHSDEVFFVTAPNLAAVATLGKILKAFQPMQIETSKFRLIVNNPNFHKSMLNGQSIAETFDMRYLGELPYEPGLLEAAEIGKAFSYRAPEKNKYKKEIARIAEYVLPLNELLYNKGKKKKR